MNDTVDSPNVVMHPPVAWALAVIVDLGVDWLFPWPYVPTFVSRVWLGGMVFAAGFLLAIWAIVAFRRAGTRVETYKPTVTIVATGPYWVPTGSPATRSMSACS
jgi:hypothetical protein